MIRGRRKVSDLLQELNMLGIRPNRKREIDDYHLIRACPRCVEAYQKARGE